MNISSSAQFYIAMEGHVQFLMRRPFWNAWSGVFHSRSRPWGHGRGIFKQVLSAIQHMHSKNVLHRDLKSDNILPHDVLGLTLDWVMIMNICEVLIPILKQYVKRCTSHHHWFLEGWLSHNSRSLGPDETVRSKVVHRLNTWHQSSCAWPAASAGFKLGLVVETWEDGWN